MKKFGFIFCMAAIFCGCGNGFSAENKSSGSNANSQKVITVCAYNTQTFFDSVKDGTEYAEFQKSQDWNRDAYLVRLERLCSIIKTLNADIYVFEEIENDAVVQDISNYLADSSWDKKKMWRYATFAKTPDTAIGCSVFSRFPIDDVKIHSLDISVQESKQPSMRPIMEVKIDADGQDLTVFVNHWKSKSGGQAETEIWRDWQESLMAGILIERIQSDENFAALLCGDFNRDIMDFSICTEDSDDDGNVILRYAGFDGAQFVKVYSPWLSGGTARDEIGSYYFRNEWERIDHIFAAGRAKITSFESKADGDWATEEGIPIAYKIYNGNGYSDHLPIMATVVFR